MNVNDVIAGFEQVGGLVSPAHPYVGVLCIVLGGFLLFLFWEKIFTIIDNVTKGGVVR